MKYMYHWAKDPKKIKEILDTLELIKDLDVPFEIFSKLVDKHSVNPREMETIYFIGKAESSRFSDEPSLNEVCHTNLELFDWFYGKTEPTPAASLNYLESKWLWDEVLVFMKLGYEILTKGLKEDAHS